ncbi:efflux RND transporter periplasmic adaptor subunit [Acidisoma sp.]|uniref:efflux RND transporter periplasmic adaptor subunit n=1 Tax=Acidisoma sp. TaxID=1872115 RepID=UPI003AFFD84D
MNTRETHSGSPLGEVAGPLHEERPQKRRRLLTGPRLALAVVVALAAGGAWQMTRHGSASPMPPPPLPLVTVSAPLQHPVGQWEGFLGQFSAVSRVELRPQVGGTLSDIDFTDGAIVHKGDLLFQIDPRPYAIKVAEQEADIRSAEAKLTFLGSELWRAQQLKRTDFGTAENVDQRNSDQRSAAAALAEAQAELANSELDMEYARVAAPFTGRIGEHQVSIGSLVTGSRAGTSGTTLLATLVSVDPMYLNFRMSEADYLAFAEARANSSNPKADQVDFSLGDENSYDHHGTLDFVDNVIDSSSGTILARATVSNPNMLIVPGEFARIRLAIAPPTAALLVPDDAIIPDQSQDMVMTVAPNGTVVPKIVKIGDLRGGLRVIRSGLAPTDRVIIDGLMHAMPGTKVAVQTSPIRFDAAADAQD